MSCGLPTEPIFSTACAGSIRNTVGPVSVMPMPLQTRTPLARKARIRLSDSGAPPQPQWRTCERSVSGSRGDRLSAW